MNAQDRAERSLQTELAEQVRSIVFKYSSATQQSISSSVLLNILTEASAISLTKNNEMAAATSDQMTTSIQVQLNTISSAISEIQKNLGLAHSNSGENNKKIRELDTKIETMQSNVRSSIQNMEDKIDEAISSFNLRASKLEKLTCLSLLKANERERRQRCFSCKVHYYYDSTLVDSDGKKREAKLSDIFDRIIRPALVEAKEQGVIEWVPPTWQQAVEHGHPLRQRPGVPPSYIIKFRSRTEMFAMMKYKDQYLSDLNEQNRLAERTYAQALESGKTLPCRIGCDLTSLDRDVLSWLCTHTEVSKAFLRGSRIVFSLHARPGYYYQVSNPFGSTLNELCQPPVDQLPWLRSSFPLSPFLQPYTQGTSNQRRKLVFDQPDKPNPLLVDDFDEPGDIVSQLQPQQVNEPYHSPHVSNRNRIQESPGLHPLQRAHFQYRQARNQSWNYHGRNAFQSPVGRAGNVQQIHQQLPEGVRDNIIRPSPSHILNRSFGNLSNEMNESAAVLSSSIGMAYIQQSEALHKVSDAVDSVREQISCITGEQVQVPPAAKPQPPAADGMPPAAMIEPAAGVIFTAGAAPPVAGVNLTAGAGPPAAGVISTAGAGPPAADVNSTAGAGPPAADVNSTAGAGPLAPGVISTAGAGPPAADVNSTASAGPPAAGVKSTAGAGPPAAGVKSTAGAGPPAAGVKSTACAGPPAAGVDFIADAEPPAAFTDSLTGAKPPAAGVPTNTDEDTDLEADASRPMRAAKAKRTTTNIPKNKKQIK